MGALPLQCTDSRTALVHLLQWIPIRIRILQQLCEAKACWWKLCYQWEYTILMGDQTKSYFTIWNI